MKSKLKNQGWKLIADVKQENFQKEIGIVLGI